MWRLLLSQILESLASFSKSFTSYITIHLLPRLILTHLNPLDLELHVVLSGGLAVLPLLPAVAVASVAHLLARVQQHRTALGPGGREERWRVEVWKGSRERKGEINLSVIRLRG